MNFQHGSVVRRTRNGLPHLDAENGAYFVTFCLADALTPSFLERHRVERSILRHEVEQRRGNLTREDARGIDDHVLQKVFDEMDRGRGSCLLGDPRLAKIVADSLRHFHLERYRLHAWTVMPTHVHVSFRSFPGYPWWRVVGAWKSFTAREVNRLLGRSGQLWQPDSFDRLIRDSNHLGRVVQYIVSNPGKAGLRDWPWVDQLIGPPYED